MNSFFISADQVWALWAVLLSCAAFGLWAERAGIGSRLSGAVITMLAAFVLSNLNIIPVTAPSYEMVWDFFVPLAIPLLLVNADLRRIITESGPTLIAFMIGACGTVVGVLVAFTVLPLGQHGWQLAAVFTATYIGGSMNYVATAKAVGLDDSSLLIAGMAADNLMMIFYFLILLSLPSINRLRSFFHERSVKPQQAAETILLKESHQSNERISPPGMAAALAMSLLICTLAFEIEKIIPYKRHCHFNGYLNQFVFGYAVSICYESLRWCSGNWCFIHANLFCNDWRQCQHSYRYANRACVAGFRGDYPAGAFAGDSACREVCQA